MNIQFWWAFDLIVVLIAVFVIISNARRGVSKCIIMAIGYIISTVLTSLLSSIGAPLVYQSVAYDTNISNIQTADRHMDYVQLFTTAIANKKYGFQVDPREVEKCLRQKKQPFDDALYDYIVENLGEAIVVRSDFQTYIRNTFIDAYGAQLGERLPLYVEMYFREEVAENPSLMRTYIQNFYTPTMSAADKAAVTEKQFAEQPTREVIQIFVYFIIFSILMILMAFVSTLLQDKLFLNVQKSTEHAVGALIGIVEAGVMVVLATMIVRVIVLMSGGQFLIFNEEAINSSYIFSFFYEHVNNML